jgi:hypothetical protein
MYQYLVNDSLALYMRYQYLVNDSLALYMRYLVNEGTSGAELGSGPPCPSDAV